jgi:hydroxymethylpyrimidine/phosphomethylpyrimidine kinase
MRVPVVLTIAGSDSSGGAGIQADLKTTSAFGVFGACAVTSVTAQNTLGVTERLNVPPPLVAAQIDAVVEDLGVDAAKTGMLATGAIVETVAERLAHHGVRALVVDPVVAATSGARLLDEGGVEALRDLLLPRALIVTPNVDEARILARVDVVSEESAVEAARSILELGPRFVLVKGGHLAGDAVDLLVDRTSVTRLESPRIVTGPVHGTGCTLSAAIASGIAAGRGVGSAVRAAKEYVARGIEGALEIGKGASVINHFVVVPEEEEQ